MKYLLTPISKWIAFLTLVLPLMAQAQAPAWQAALALNTVTTVTASAADASGNVYLIGSFTGTAEFGSFSLASAGGQDVFVAKWHGPSGRFVWAKRAGGTRDDMGKAVAVSGTSIYITGDFSSSLAAFGSLSISNSGFLNTTNVFVAKLTDAGTSSSFTWANQAGGLDQDTSVGLAVSGTNVYITGSFEGAGVTFGSTSLTSLGANDIYVAKVADGVTSAQFLWALRMGSSSYEYPYAVAASGTSVYVTGHVGGTMTFGTPPDASLGNSTGGNDAFVVKLTDAGVTGSFAWMQRARGQTNTVVHPLAISVDGANVYIAGDYYITGTLGPAVLFGNVLLSQSPTNGINNDGFVAKLTDAGPTGSFTWAYQVGGYCRVQALQVRGPHIYVASTFRFSARALNTFMLTSAGGRDVFVAKLLDAGSSASAVWAQQAGGTGDETVTSIALSGNGLHMAGSAMAPAYFGSTMLMHTLRGESFGYVATLADNALSTAASRLSAGLRLYPNPAHARATVQLPAGLAASAATFTLRDALGRAVRTYEAALPASLRYEVDLRNLTPGVYLLHVQVAGAAGAHRLVVE